MLKRIAGTNPLLGVVLQHGHQERLNLIGIIHFEIVVIDKDITNRQGMKVLIILKSLITLILIKCPDLLKYLRL
jgi:hypothetical protein